MPKINVYSIPFQKGSLTHPLLKIPYSRVISSDLANEFNNTAPTEGESIAFRNHSFTKMETNVINVGTIWFFFKKKILSRPIF
jgi:hypothetical protein